MARRSAPGLACVAGLALLIQATGAWAFVTQKTDSGIPLRWSARSIPVPFVLNQAGTPDTDGAFDAIRAAFQTWGTLPAAGITFRDMGLTALRRVANDGVNLLIFLSTDLDPADFAGGDTIAVAGTIFDTITGEIVDCDIVFNNRDNRFATTSTPGIADVQSVATHEVGHLIGLDHSMVPTASMAPTLDVSLGELRRVLTADDVAGAAFLYPVPGVPPVAVALQVNQPAYRPGDTLVLTAGAGNGATEASPVDMYVSVRLPGNQVLYLANGSFTPQALPLVTTLALPPGRSVGPVEIVRFPVPANVPPGAYTWEAELVQPGTRTPWAQATAPFTIGGP